MNVLELGNYVVPAYAGMILAEQGHRVTKWTNGRDPLLDLTRGEELWGWINHGKRLEYQHAANILQSDVWPDVVLDNFRPEALAEWGIDPARIAEQRRLVWVSMRSETGGRSFDVVAQARAWGDWGPWVPFWIGDTAGGLWMAFKALAMAEAKRPGHYVLGQASCLAKLVEGEMVVSAPERKLDAVPWENGTYELGPIGAFVGYKDDMQYEPRRGLAWRLANLWHNGGRFRI